MQIIETTSLAAEQKEFICRLWNQEYPANLSFNTMADFDNYLNNLTATTHYLLQNDFGQIDGWAFTFTRESEKWFAILLDRKIQGQGKGSLLLDKLKEKEQKLHGWVVDHDNYVKSDGQPYLSPLPFYLKNGFTVCSNTRFETEQLSAVKITWKAKQNAQL
jgi:GNAT superfamily N-acetyltransferase